MIDAGLSFDAILELTGGQLGVHDAACPQCGPDRRYRHNQRRRVLRIWREDPDFARFYCIRCGAHGFARANSVQNLDQQQLVRIEAVDRLRREQARRAAACARNALKIWNEARPAQGTIVERYFIGRALDPTFASLFRFHPRCPHPNGIMLPAMVALVEHAKRGPVAIHRTYLQADGSGKALIAPDRANLGPIAGGAVRLTPLVPGEWLIVGEGNETILSVIQACRLPGWAALSAVGVEKLILPPEARMVIICADHDWNGRGQRAAHEAAERFLSEGRLVRVAMPPSGVDFNDILTGRAQIRVEEIRHVA